MPHTISLEQTAPGAVGERRLLSSTARRLTMRGRQLVTSNTDSRSRERGSTGRFIWIISRDGDWKAAEEVYYGSAKRRALVPNPAQYIAQANEWFTTPVKLRR